MTDAKPESKLWISGEDYVNIFSKVPRVCIDLIIRGDKGVLLALRAIDPYIGMWHLPGGMIYKGESFLDAAKRVAKKEVGLDVVSAKIIDQFEMLHEVRVDHVQHIISLVCEVKIKTGNSEGESLLLHDFQSSELRYFSYNEVPGNLIPFHREALEKILNC